MKKIIKPIFILLIFMCVAFSSVFALDSDFKSLDITLLNQNPDPVYAGDVVELALSLDNVGYGTLDGISLQVENDYPFTVVSDNNIQLSKIYSSSDYTSNVKIKLKVDSNAKAGDYAFVIKEINAGVVIEHTINISVASNKNVEIVNINKNSITPGGIENFSFTIKNVGNTNLKNLGFSWNNENSILLPVNGDNKVFINSLNIGEEKVINFTISASSASSADLYKINLVLSYEDTKTSQVTQETSTAGIYVGGKTDFDIIYNSKDSGEYVFTIANIGANDADSVKVSVDDSSKWKTSSKSSEIIGNLNKGDYTTLSYNFIRTSGNLNLKVDYTDTSGNRVSTIKKIKIDSINNLNSNSTFLKNQNAKNMKNSDTNRRNPMGGLQGGLTTIGTWFKNLGYLILIVLILFIGFRVYKKTIGKKVKN